MHRLLPFLPPRRPRVIVPVEHRDNFRRLYHDIAWFGILNGTILSFLSIFAARTGASNQQIGILGAAPAIANLLFSLPASVFLQKIPTAKGVAWSSIAQRIFYLMLALLPMFVTSQPLIWAIIVGTFVMSIPGTGLAVGINALIAQTVPIEWRAHVVGTRNALLSLFTIVALFISGQILTVLPYPLNYQVVFFLGFLGGMLSSINLFLIKPRTAPALQSSTHAQPPEAAGERKNHVSAEVRRKIRQANTSQPLTLKTLKGKFGLILFMLFMFNFALYLSVPLFPLYQVNILKLSDRVISLGSSFFQITTLIVSTQIGFLARKYSNHKLTGIGLSSLVVYPLLLPLSKTALIFMLVSAMGGIAWAMVNGALVNYLLEQIPSNDLAGHFAWYNLAMNAAILLGSLSGPLIATQIGLTAALIIFGLGRLLSGLALLRWG